MIPLLSLVSVVSLFLASVSDLRTREVPDYLSYFLICLGLVNQIFLFFSLRFYYFFVNLLVAVLALLFSLVMYKFKQWGGADAKLLVGIALLISYDESVPLFIFYFINFLWVGAFYGLLSTLILVLLNFRRFMKFFTADYFKRKFFYWFCFGVVVSSPFSLFISRSALLSFMIFLMGFIFLLSMILKNANKLMIKSVSVDKLTEGDWVSQVVTVDGVVIFNPKKDVSVNKSQLEIIKKSDISRVRIIEGMPFVPALALAFIITLFFPNILVNFFMVLSGIF